MLYICIAKLSMEQYLKLMQCVYTKLTEQRQQFILIPSINSRIVKLVKSHSCFHSDHDSDSNSNISSYPRIQRLCALQGEQRKICMDQHDSSNQADGNLCRSFSVAHGKLSGVTGNECGMNDENGPSKHLIPELYSFFLKTIQTRTSYCIDVTLLLQEEGKYIYTGNM